MNSDEERMFDPRADDDEDVTRVLDAGSVSTDTSETLTVHSSNNNTPPPTSTPTRLEPSRRWFILEPAVFLIFLAKYLSASVYQNQILYQTCVTVLHFNETACQPLLGVSRETPEAEVIEAQVQPYVTKILMTRSLLESIIPALVSLFIGPWSDKFGRRPIILTTFFGYFASYCILALITFIATKVQISPWLFLLSSVPSILSGGTCALITGIYCYISDVAQEKARAARMVLNEASLCAGIMIGNVAGGYLYEATNVLIVFTISGILMLLALLYAVIFVKESLKPEQIHGGSKIREFFRFDLVKDLVQTCFKRRRSYDRAIIWLTMTALTIAIFTMEGDGNVMYLFVRRKFEWTVKDYSLYNASRIIVQIVGSVLGIYLLRKTLKFSIVTMTMLSFASLVLESTVRATAVYWWEMYLGFGLGMMCGVMGPMARAILSHVAPPTEVGKIFALTTSLESLSPLGAAPLYTLVYTATLTYNPGLFNFISAGLYLLCFSFISVIFSIQKSIGHSSPYEAIST